MPLAPSLWQGRRSSKVPSIQLAASKRARFTSNQFFRQLRPFLPSWWFFGHGGFKENDSVCLKSAWRFGTPREG